MIQVEFNLGQVAERARQLGAAVDQLPYVLATTLNEAADKTRQTLIDAWPGYVHARNASFIGASLTTRGARASKTDLSVAIYDKLGRGHLKLHAEGGVRAPVGQHLAIPAREIAANKTARGVRADERPRWLRNSFKKNNMILQRVGRGKDQRVRVAYFLRTQGNQPKDVPFYNLFADAMRNALTETLPGRVVRAMSTRR